MLLSASDRYPEGLANSSGMVGRNLMDHPSTSLTFDAEEPLWLGRGPQSPSSINAMRDGAFRAEHAAYRLDFTNISRVDGATRALIAAGVYGPEFEKRLRHSAAHEMNVKTVLEVLPHPDRRITLVGPEGRDGASQASGPLRDRRLHPAGHARGKRDFQRIADLMGGTNLQLQQGRGFRQQSAHLRHAQHGKRSSTLRLRRLWPGARP